MQKSTLSVLVSSLFVLFGGQGAAAQEIRVFEPIGAAVQSAGVAFGVPGQGPELGLIAVEPFDTVSPVTGAPYTADAITEVTQVLSDGNRIEQRASVAIARDARGRVRREHQAMVFGGMVARSQIPLVTISDPATGTHVTLDHERRVAYRVNTPVSRVVVRRDFEVSVRAGSEGRAEGPMMNFVGGRRIGPGAVDGADVRTEPLGERTIEGVRSEGTRTTMTIPADAVGNLLPIHVVSERWYSPDLRVVVLTRRSDPRFGETVYRLANVVRAEPPADLFEVPNDYRVDEQNLLSPRIVEPAGR